MSASNTYLIILIVVLASIASLVFVVRKNSKRLTSLAGLAFVLLLPVLYLAKTEQSATAC